MRKPPRPPKAAALIPEHLGPVHPGHTAALRSTEKALTRSSMMLQDVVGDSVLPNPAQRPTHYGCWISWIPWQHAVYSVSEFAGIVGLSRQVSWVVTFGSTIAWDPRELPASRPKMQEALAFSTSPAQAEAVCCVLVHPASDAISNS